MRPLFLSLLLAIAATAAASHVEGCTMTTYTDDDLVSVAGQIYIVNDADDCHMCVLSIWVYGEQNGIPGLQRADEFHDDTCGHWEQGDGVVL